MQFSTVFVIAILVSQSWADMQKSNTNLFASDLISHIVDNKPKENVVFSPASIHSTLALAYLGAEGVTAGEIRNVLRVGEEDKLDFSRQYGNYLRNTFPKTKAENGNAPQLKLATRLYVNENVKLLAKFNKIAVENLDSQAENVDFSQAATAAAKINGWVEEQTENKIKNLMDANSISGDTSAILVNAIYFKAKWLNPFSEIVTSKAGFYISTRESLTVDMMFTDDTFGYAELDNLDAKALEMPYDNSDISMLVLLPNDIDGLAKLEKNLKGIDFNDITARLKVENVDVHLPKFRIEYDIDLKQPLGQMGCSSLFGPNANLTGIFESAVPQRISEVKHKAFFDCNEAGSEAAAATYMKIIPMSLNLDQKTFLADHPFFFVVRSKTTVFFAGHVARFS